jgi:dihydropteroate synthase
MMRPEGAGRADAVPADVMGVVNVTPDSFSDGGRFLDPDAAIAHGLRLAGEGAVIIDVGGESTRPGAEPVDPLVEQRRVLPVVTELARHVRVSIDTRNRSTAEAAVDAGATLINDVSSTLAPVAATAGVGWVAMHMQGDPRTMQADPQYDDVVTDVAGFLRTWADDAVAAGVDEVWIDPGFGFGKTIQHNLELLAHLDVLAALGYPVLVGLSRKRFLGVLLAASDRRASAPPLPGLGTAVLDSAEVVPPSDRIEGSIATAVWAVAHGARMVRAHDVAVTAEALTSFARTEASWRAA